MRKKIEKLINALLTRKQHTMEKITIFRCDKYYKTKFAAEMPRIANFAPWPLFNFVAHSTKRQNHFTFDSRLSYHCKQM